MGSSRVGAASSGRDATGSDGVTRALCDLTAAPASRQSSRGLTGRPSRVAARAPPAERRGARPVCRREVPAMPLPNPLRVGRREAGGAREQRRPGPAGSEPGRQAGSPARPR